MTLRQLQLTGYSTGANLAILCNQVTIFEGQIGNVGSENAVEPLVQWEQDFDTTPVVDVALQVEVRCVTGALHCVDVLINQFSNQVLKSELSWPRIQPTRGELFDDLIMLNDDELLDKYALSRQQLLSCFELSDTWTSTGNFTQAYALGDRNPLLCKINGVVQTPLHTDQLQGPWHWFLQSGQNLTFDLVVCG